MEAEAVAAALPRPVFPRGLEQVERAGDVGLDEIGRTVDRPVDVALGGQVHHRLRRMGGEDPVERSPVADIRMLEGIEEAVGDGGQVGLAGGVGQGVEIDHVMAAGDGQADHGGADEARAPGDEKFHAAPLVARSFMPTPR